LSKKIDERIDWNFLGHGKLWNYQLQSFDFLLQKDLAKPDGEKLLLDFYDFSKKNPQYFEPYPASLRIINCIKYISIHKTKIDPLPQSVKNDAGKLFRTLEQYLENNH